LGSQENRIGANAGEYGTFYNLFRLIFIVTDPVIEVSVTLIDSNLNPQIHTLTAFDAAGNIVDVDSFTENDLFPDPFTLTVASSGGIAFVVALEQPYGAEILNQISYTIEPNTEIGVSIDIKPGSDTNPINIKSKGKTPVAILSTEDFDAPSMVDTSSLAFGKTGDESSLAFCDDDPEDVNEDGLLDLVCLFNTRKTGFQLGDLKGILKGKTVDDIPLEGSDVVRIQMPSYP